MFVSILIAGKNPDETACVAGGCVTHATCDTSASPTICECDTGYTASPTSTPTMCKFTISYNKLATGQYRRYVYHFYFPIYMMIYQ